jgi:hypothetical protein
MAHRAEKLDPMMRYPYPNWTPIGGWRIDPSLVYAHSLQESAFRTSVISSAGARGLMQVKPSTAQEMARARGSFLSTSDLDRPSVNLEYGQSYIEKLRDMNATGGLLPKVIAAYNAGPAPVTAGIAKSATMAIHCCLSNRSPIGKPAAMSRSSCATTGCTKSSAGKMAAA